MMQIRKTSYTERLNTTARRIVVQTTNFLSPKYDVNLR